MQVVGTHVSMKVWVVAGRRGRGARQGIRYYRYKSVDYRLGEWPALLKRRVWLEMTWSRTTVGTRNPRGSIESIRHRECNVRKLT